MQQELSLFCKKSLRQKQERAIDKLNETRFLLDWSGAQLQSRLQDITRRFEKIAFLSAKDTQNWRNNIAAQTGATFQCTNSFILQMPAQNMIIADDEILPFGHETLDLMISNLHLHSLNDLPGALIQARRALKPDGLFLAAMLGGETLYELREALLHAETKIKGGASPRIMPFADKPQMGDLMQRAGYSLPVIDSEIITVTYDNIFKLMHDLRNMGETSIISARQKHFTSRNIFMETANYYAQHFSESDGRIRASFEIIFLIGWAPHESQQKPLKPGSAKLRLADALGAQEKKL